MSIPNLMQGRQWRQELNAVHYAMLRVTTCCYFFSLKLGCKLIVVFENILGLWQMYQGCSELYGRDDKSPPRWTHSKPIEQNAELNILFGLIAFFCSHLLLIGVVFQRKICVLIWISVMAVCIVAFLLYTQVFGCRSDTMLWDTFISALQGYFLGIGLVYYMHMGRREETDEDLEVLFTISEV
ncbi:uncharacterized protein LOC26527360 [Drosophila mojavensis]|uniref:Uncharacterized protein, isoform A n=2 Tax=Drosophila mojavensis TaxID=7230 RepID=A0A0Q9X7E4_DROMO|nr:uncharacterized protein LOC26527360 [Drosophila mojavensis]KRG04240.1 uncharacterized protein Dmoj_GI25719, isoform A [Drosophila mojavensis]